MISYPSDLAPKSRQQTVLIYTLHFDPLNAILLEQLLEVLPRQRFFHVGWQRIPEVHGYYPCHILKNDSTGPINIFECFVNRDPKNGGRPDSLSIWFQPQFIASLTKQSIVELRGKLRS
jgi:hypothetical protein